MKPGRTGFTLLEVVAASIVLGALMVATLQMLAWQNVQRRVLDTRQVALAEASRILDRLTWESWDRLTPERVQLESFSAKAASSFNSAALKITLTESNEGQLQAKRLQVEISWPRAQAGLRPVRLVAWRYRQRTGAGT